jgi:hypothetical protein
MIKIGYDERASFDENVDNDIELITQVKKLLKDDIKRACVIPCGNKRNIDLCELFNFVVFCDINKKIISSFTEPKYSNFNVIQMDIMNMSPLSIDIILIMRQAIQMFNKDEIIKIFKSIHEKTNTKYILVDTFFYDGKDLSESPNYFTDTTEVFDTINKIYLTRKTTVNINAEKIVLIHKYMHNGKTKYETEINLINYTRANLMDIFHSVGAKTAYIFESERINELAHTNRSIFLLKVSR